MRLFSFLTICTGIHAQLEEKQGNKNSDKKCLNYIDSLMNLAFIL